MEEMSIVIPVYNSQDNLEELNRQVSEALAGRKYHLILVNDGSKDESWNVIRELHRQNTNVLGVNLRKNAGQDNAIMAGLQYARGDYVVIMDDDLQHNPFDIITLYDACKKGYDVCYAHFLKKKQTWWKNIGSWLNSKIAVLLLKKPRHIYMSPFQIVKREIIQEVLKYSGAYPYVQGLILQITNNVTQVDIEHRERYRGKSNFNLRKSISVFLTQMTSFSVVPLRVSTVIGFVTACIGFIMSIVFVILFFISKDRIQGWTTLISTTLVLGGLILMSIGLIGEYLGRMYLNINCKPQYSIKEFLSSND